MKASRGVTVVGLSAALVATGWAAGTGFATPAQSAAAPAAGDSATATPRAATPSATASASPTATPSASTTPSPTASATETATAAATYDGESVSTRYGAFQAQITVTDGQITDIVMLKNGEREPRSQRINSQAIPLLTQRVLEAQSAAVDAVSGASFTSYGFLTSVDAAIQAAGLS